MSGEITITRVYRAPRERVWAAWTEPERLAAWWGKRGWRTPPESVTIDLRPGGAFRLRSIADADGATMTLEATYHEVVAPERLVFGGPPGDRRSMVTFTDLGDGRSRVTSVSVVDSLEGRNAILSSGMEVGVYDGYAKLDALLADD